MQDPNPLPWGAQDRFQAHFIVQQNSDVKLIRQRIELASTSCCTNQT